MDYLLGNLPVLVSVILFFLTLIIILILRASDKKNLKLPIIKKLVEKYESEIERSCESFRTETAETEAKVAQKISEVKDLLQTVSAQIKEISSYSDDMAKLRTAMKTYHDALDGLARLSADADQKVAEVTEDTHSLEEVRKDIEKFQQDMKDADEHLTKHEQRVVELETSSLTKLEETTKSANDAIESCNTEIDRIADEKINYLEQALENLRNSVEKNLVSMEDRLDTFKNVAETITGNGKDILANICERSSEMLLASETVESLVMQRDRLEKQISELAELKKLEEEHINIARTEYQRLSKAIEGPQQEEQVEEKQEEEQKETVEIKDMEIPSFDSLETSETPETQEEVKKEYYGNEEVVPFDN